MPSGKFIFIMDMGGSMVNKVIETLKDGIIVPKLLLGSYKKLNITAEELILVIYFLGNNVLKLIFPCYI